MRVNDFMKKEIITVDINTPIMAALETMKHNKIKRLPVTKSGKFVGLVTRAMIQDASMSYGDLLLDPAEGIENQVSENQRRNTLSKKLDQFHKHLSGREAYIFKNRIMSEETLTLQNIGYKYNISRERVRQIQ